MPNFTLSQDIKSIIVKDFSVNGFKNKDGSDYSITNLGLVNFFIGANNSGKSRLIRHLYNNKITNIELYSAPSIELYNSIVSNSEKSISTPGFNADTFLSKEQEKLILKKIHDNIEKINSATATIIIEKLSKLIRESMYEFNDGESDANDRISIENSLLKGIDLKRYEKTLSFNPNHFKYIYIPILRNLRPLFENKHIETINKQLLDEEADLYLTDLYLNRTVSDYGINNETYSKHSITNEIEKTNGDVNYSIFTGYSIYEDVVSYLLGGHDTRKIIADYEEFLSVHFFDNQKVTLTPKQNKDVVYIKIGGQKERPIYELGDGLQTVIIITFPVFTANKPTHFFIEEPETHLHAGLQRSLIDALSSKKEHQYFITTHSNHFIDLTQERDDVTIQRVFQEQQNDGSFVTCVDNLAKDTELLDDLGVRASSVLLANCSIWVEGVTDKLYLRAYMKKYINELRKTNKEEADKLSSFKENLHYIFTEYQGSNITHWYFGENTEILEDECEKQEHAISPDEEQTPAKKISKKLLLIADGDISGKNGRDKKLSDEVGEDFFHLLSCKEIENTLPKCAVEFSADKLWNRFQKRRKEYNDESGNKVIVTFTPSQIATLSYESSDIGLGEHLDSLINKRPDVTLKSSGKTVKSGYFSESGTSSTVKNKKDFCKLSIEYMSDPSNEWQLTDSAYKLCEAIFEHIKDSNY